MEMFLAARFPGNDERLLAPLTKVVLVATGVAEGKVVAPKFGREAP